MHEIITISREKIKERLDEFFENMPLHVFILELISFDKESIFDKYESSDFSEFHTDFIFLDNIKPPKIKEGECGVTKEKADEIQEFVFRVRNHDMGRSNKFIVVCDDGLSVSGAIALWAMDWLMDSDEEAFNKLNPDIKPNEMILRDLYLHPII
jgi:predicted protein tyrosine phosphatase